MEKELKRLNEKIAEIDDFGRIMALISWDQEANMPEGGYEARGQQMATLSKLIHQKSVDPEFEKLLAVLEPKLADMDADSNDAAQIRLFSKEYKRATVLPEDMVAEKAQLSSASMEAWMKAKEENDFSIFQPLLEKFVDWMHRYVDLFAPYDHVYDPLLDMYEPGFKSADVTRIFDDLRAKQTVLLQKIAEAEQVDDSFLFQYFDPAAQKSFGREVVTALGFDWKKGMEGSVHHPFMTNIGYGDQRINTNVHDNEFNPYLFGMIHECGHGLYEMGITKEKARTMLYNGTSMAIHESQSRLYENLVARSKPFWQYFFGTLQGKFPTQFGGMNVDTFYRGINKVNPSLIRIEADEATYNMHIMLRYEIEIALMEGKLAVKDLPDYWNAKMKEYLGVEPDSDSNGVLQDVHWAHGLFGYFPTYALGNLASAQIWDAMLKDIPDIDDKMAAGDFEPLLGWLTEKIYQHGSLYEPQDLLQRVTGQTLQADAYLAYLDKKFGAIYGF